MFNLRLQNLLILYIIANIFLALGTHYAQLIFNFSSVNDAPYPWQIGFQDPASPGFTGIVDLHNNVSFFLILILLGVVWILGVVIVLFKNNLISAKYLNHATFAEVV